MASKMRVVPVSTIPDVVAKIGWPPKSIDWSIPQKVDAGLVVVTGTKLTADVVFDVSTPPKVSSPALPMLEGSKNVPTTSFCIVPCAKRLSATVGTVLTPVTVLAVRSVGPILIKHHG